MAVTKRIDFFSTEEGVNFLVTLEQMTADRAYNTPTTYTSNEKLYPNNQMSFVDRHMNYINTHPKIDADKYLSNLRLMTNLR